MNDFKKAKRYLEKIAKLGDLFDVISLKENRKYMDYSFFKMNALYFSRILYGIILIGEKIKSHFAPIEEVKKAQNEIRKIIGVPVDIIASKRKLDLWDIQNSFFPAKKTLSILYRNIVSSLDDYIEDLKKILEFCELHKISTIFLRTTDMSLKKHPLFEKFARKELRQILCYALPAIKNAESFSIEEELNTDYFDLDCEDLQYFIQLLESLKIDKQTILNFREKIDDLPVKKAINIYLKKYDLSKLKEMVKQRLALVMNSDNTFKDRKNGKVIQNVTIQGKFIQVLSMNVIGNVMNTQVLSFYDYFEVTGYEELLKKAENEDKDLFSMAAFYLYLLNCVKRKNNIHYQKSESFFDQLYESYQKKKQGKIKKISGLYPKKYRIFDLCFSFGNASGIVMFLLAIVLIVTSLWDGFQFLFLHKRDFDSFTFEKVLEFVAIPYKESCAFEKDLVSSVVDELRSNPYLNNSKITTQDDEEVEEVKEEAISSQFTVSTGDSLDDGIEEKRIAEVISIEDEVSMPIYYASGVAWAANYSSGEMNYYMDSFACSFADLQNEETLFEIRYKITKDDLTNAIFLENINGLPVLYPLGQNYVVTCITLYDADHPEKTVMWDYHRKDFGLYLSETERDFLSTIEKPEISYGYGISESLENTILTSSLKKTVYTKSPSMEIKNAIREGLQLEKNASISEFYEAIQSKDYSITPIKDAKLTEKIKEFDEIEYFETIASLDSLICNLAATLAVGTDSSLYYTVGYANLDDSYILQSEAHAWAMTKEGNIIDITPSKKEKDYFPVFFCIFTVAGVLFFRRQGKKVIFYGKCKAVENMLSDPSFKKTYARFHKMLYGGINLVCDRSSIGFLESIAQEFHGITKEELKEIRSELEHKKQFNYKIDQFTQRIPFIVENQDILKRNLEKKKN